MNWITGMQNVIDYIEENITEEIDYSKIAKIAYSSNYHFQKIFSILCGFTIGDYIRFRRLSLAGKELSESDVKIVDTALKYGYDTPESFTKAFTRFHGVTPTVARKSGVKLQFFNRLIIQISMKGGDIMDYNIDKNDVKRVDGNQVYSDLDFVRKYPRTFIGSTSLNGLHHMVYELVSNAIDEALAGYCTNINVRILKNNFIEISDNGRGIPTFINKKTGISILESVFTTVYDRGEGIHTPMIFDNNNAVGLGVINALSEWIEVEVYNGKDIKYIKFMNGRKTSDITVIGNTDRTGTTVRFKPDFQIFEDITFDYAEINSKLEEQALLVEDLSINFTDYR